QGKATESISDGPKRARSARESTARAVEDQYVQKEGLFAEPLSLDDLLRDDLDEGPLTPADFAESGSTLEGENDTPGGVIDYEADFSSPPPPPARRNAGAGRRPPHRPDKSRNERNDQARGGEKRKREKLEARPREDFGKKRGGKRVFSAREEGR